MAKKAKKKSSQGEIRKLAEAGKLVIGTERVIKQLKTGKIKKVLMTINCPAEVKETVKRYAGLSKAEIEELDMPNDELGVACKKPFSISMAGVVKE